MIILPNLLLNFPLLLNDCIFGIKSKDNMRCFLLAFTLFSSADSGYFCVFQLTMALSGDTIPVDFATLTEMQAVTTLVRAVQNAIEAQRKALVGESNFIYYAE